MLDIWELMPLRLSFFFLHLESLAIPVDDDPFWWNEALLNLFSSTPTVDASLTQDSLFRQRKLLEVGGRISGLQDSAHYSNDLRQIARQVAWREGPQDHSHRWVGTVQDLAEARLGVCIAHGEMGNVVRTGMKT